jgi:hypothetical protein
VHSRPEFGSHSSYIRFESRSEASTDNPLILWVSFSTWKRMQRSYFKIGHDRSSHITPCSWFIVTIPHLMGALGYRLDDRGSRVRFPAGVGIFLFTIESRTVLGPTQNPIQWVPGALSLGVKRPGRKADHSPPSSAAVKECVELYSHSSNTPSWRGAQLKRSTGTNLHFTTSNSWSNRNIN